MSLLDFFRKKGSAPMARERLQILLSHERAELGSRGNLIHELREEIIAVVARHIAIDPINVNVRMERGATQSLLEIEIELPHPGRGSGRPSMAA
jgi:cell division topological specificity factor